VNLLLDRKIINQAQAGNGRVFGSSYFSLFFLKVAVRYFVDSQWKGAPFHWRGSRFRVQRWEHV